MPEAKTADIAMTLRVVSELVMAFIFLNLQAFSEYLRMTVQLRSLTCCNKLLRKL
jgi:hypothetical protein